MGLRVSDIDLDLPNGTDIRKLFPSAVPASRVHEGELTKHPCGHYFENIPVDPLTGLAAIPHRDAEDMGYTKIDFLHLNLLSQFSSKAEFRRICKQPPDWSMLLDPVIVPTLFQVGKHLSTLRKVRPRSIRELADVIALIRPTKRHLLEDYVCNKEKIRPLLFRLEEDDKSAFRESHSLAYSVTVVAQLNLIRGTKKEEH